MRQHNSTSPAAFAFALLTLAALSASCGSNVFSSAEKSDPAQDAVIDLEKKDPDSAIERLESALLLDPGNPKLLSILSAAYAQRAGIEPLRFAAKVAESNLDGATSNFASLYSVVQKPTETILADIDKAVAILANDIAVDDYQPGDKFKIGLFQTASMVLHTKALDRNGDGKITPDELLDLSSASAGDLLSQLNAARTVLAAAGSDEPTMQKAAETLGQFQAQIAASPGATSEEKLKSFIATVTGGAASTP